MITNIASQELTREKDIPKKAWATPLVILISRTDILTGIHHGSTEAQFAHSSPFKYAYFS